MTVETTTPTADAVENTSGKRARPPQDAAARDAAAKRRAVTKALKKAKDAKNLDELRALITDEKSEQKAEQKTTDSGEVDPLDVPVRAGWPTPRQMAEVEPMADFVLGGLAMVAEGTRYSLSASMKLPGGGELSRVDILKPRMVAAMAAAEGPTLTPSQELMFIGAMVFGLPALRHLMSEGVPALKKAWAARSAPQGQVIKRPAPAPTPKAETPKPVGPVAA